MEFFILIFAIFFMSLTYLLIGFGINKNNAEYLLAGYNTMTPEQKKFFNIEKYLEFFNSFNNLMLDNVHTQIDEFVLPI